MLKQPGPLGLCLWLWIKSNNCWSSHMHIQQPLHKFVSIFRSGGDALKFFEHQCPKTKGFLFGGQGFPCRWSFGIPLAEVTRKSVTKLLPLALISFRKLCDSIFSANLVVMGLVVFLHELKKSNLAFSTMRGIDEIELCHVDLLVWDLLLLFVLPWHDAFGNLLEGFEGILRNFEAYLAKHSQTNFEHHKHSGGWLLLTVES